MRNAILISILTVVLMVGAASVYAGPPINGTYKSTLGQFDEGREASSWSAGGGFLSTGGILHAESWDGVGLGADWKIVCPQVVSIALIVDLVNGAGNASAFIRSTTRAATSPSAVLALLGTAAIRPTRD
jgi:hypothetical protein